MKRLLALAFLALLLAAPAGPARADDDPVKLMQDLNKLNADQLELADKFKENTKQADIDKKKFDQLNKDDTREKKEHAVLKQQRAQVKAACVGIIQEGTLIEHENACSELKIPFEQNIEIHNAAIAHTAEEYKQIEEKEKLRDAEAKKLSPLDLDEKAQVYALKRKILIAIKNVCIPNCSNTARVTGCIQNCWERARWARQLPRLPGDKPEPPPPATPLDETVAPPAPPSPPPPADPGDPLAGAPKQTTQ